MLTATMSSATSVAAAATSLRQVRTRTGRGHPTGQKMFRLFRGGHAAVTTMMRRGVVRSSRAARGPVGVSAGWVLVNSGPKTADHLGEEVDIPGDLALTATRMVLGRQASDSVSLEVAVPTVSGAHAIIESTADKVTVTDLSSTNGTFIEGEELQTGVAYELAEGGEVIFGDEYLACYILTKV